MLWEDILVTIKGIESSRDLAEVKQLDSFIS